MFLMLLFLAADPSGFQATQTILKKNCAGCHSGAKPSGGFSLAKVASEKSLDEETRAWVRVLTRVREGEMPPKQAPALAMADRDRVVNWIDQALHQAACADGTSPGPAPLRRLNRAEFGSTVRDLLNIHVNAGHALPLEGSGGEGFDNAAETLFISPIHAEKYLEAARQALEYAFKDPKSRTRFLTAKPDGKTTPEAAARQVLEAFVPRAFRRPARPGEVDRYHALFLQARQRQENFDRALAYAMQGVLMSPHFLFRLEDPNLAPAPRLVDGYALASRLSYFLWGSMPDDALFDLAGQGKLQDPKVLEEQIARMLKDTKSLEASERFVEQWLGTRELGRDIKPDQKLFPAWYDEEIQSGLKYEPVIFYQEVLASNRSLLDFIDSNWTILTNKTQRHYEITLLPGTERLRQQPRKVDLPPDSHRGGLLGMGAILAVSSLSNRTSPVHRGKWILDAMLGTPAPPPPPNVPPLGEAHDGAPKTLRQRLELHRTNPVCAACHAKMDPLGFALENYDVLGRWRTTDNGQPVDTRAELPDGTKFDGPQGLKQVLMERKRDFLRNLTAKLLGYALGRGLTLEEGCTVDRILGVLEKDGYKAQTLVREIVMSVPFRYQAGTNPKMPVPGTLPGGL